MDENLLVKPSDMEGFVTAAYARMTDIPSWDSPFSPWWSGSLRSDDSYKGGGGVWDGGDGWGYMETFVNLTLTAGLLISLGMFLIRLSRDAILQSKNAAYFRRRFSSEE